MTRRERAILFVLALVAVVRIPSSSVHAAPEVRAAAHLDDKETGDLSASQDFEVEVGRSRIFGLASIWICVTDADDSVTEVEMTCTGSHDNNTTDYVLQEIDAAGASTDEPSLSKNPSAMANKCWLWRLDIEGVEDFECTLSDTGGDGDDSYDVDVTLASKGG